MFGGKRWWFTTCALFMLCPRRPHVTAMRFRPLGKPFGSKLSLNTLQNKGSSSRLEDAEPGFDFEEEEMKKLKIWPGGAIPYYIDEFSFDKVFRDRIRNFLDVTNSATGLNFLELHRPPGDDETRWVFFINRQGLLNCVDHPFKNFTSEGVQKILLGYNCLNSAGQLAEVILALVGVPPQHNAPNRNKYIKIIKENIMPGKAHLFEVFNDKEWLFHEIDYDFASAGHYNLHKYTVNGKATIAPEKSIQDISIGEGKGFSYTDIWKIRMIYNYISKKRIKSVSMPECNKLFNIGNNFSNYVHDSEEDVQPRKKPNKYLGLPDEPDPTVGSKEINNKSKKENSDESDPKQKDNLENENQKSDDTKEKQNKDISESKGEAGNSGENITGEKSEAQPDYKNDDDHVDMKPQLLKFIRPGHKNY